jgi:hypothetical protein
MQKWEPLRLVTLAAGVIDAPLPAAARNIQNEERVPETPALTRPRAGFSFWRTTCRRLVHFVWRCLSDASRASARLAGTECNSTTFIFVVFLAQPTLRGRLSLHNRGPEAGRRPVLDVQRRDFITLLGGAAANGPSSLKLVCRRHGADAAGDSLR